MTLLAGAVSVYSQGSVAMTDYFIQNGSLAATVQVFTGQGGAGSLVTDGAYSGYEVMGNSANTYNAHPGSAVYATGTTLGPGYDIGLLGAAGTQTSYSALSLATGSVVSSWLNSSINGPGIGLNGNYGVWNAPAAVATVPGVTTGGVATIAIAAWQNSGADGAATTLAAAQADGYMWGVSDMVTTTLATGDASPGNLPSSLTDFSLAVTIPEPSTIALGVIGASALLFRRRK